MRRIRKKYEKPRHPWQKARIEEEAKLKQEYGYKGKRELWRMEAILRGFRVQARKLIGMRGKQAELEKERLLGRLYRLKLLPKGAKVEDVLALSIRDILERRLQTLVHKKGLANTIKQARQLITHGHILIGEKKLTSPSYLVSRKEERKIKLAG